MLVVSNEIVQSITKALVEINNELQLHEGAVALVDFKEGVVYLQQRGSCVGCEFAACGLFANLEHKLKKAVRQIKKVVVL